MELQPLYMETLTPEMVKKAEIELNETPEVRRNAVNQLRQLIKDEPDFYPLTEEAFLVRFLRVKKYNVPNAFKTLRNYYAFKARHSGYLTEFLPSEVDRIMATNTIHVSSKRNIDGSDIIILFLGAFDPDKTSREEFAAANFVVGEVNINVEALQVCGCTAICDFKGITIRKLLHFASPSFLANFIGSLQDCYPVRMKGFHMVHEPAYFNILYTVMKPLLGQKLKDRFHFHGNNLKNLHKFVSPEALPEELGGTQGPADNRKYREYMLSKEDLVARVRRSRQRESTINMSI